MAKTERIYARVPPDVYAELERMAKRGGFRSVPNFAKAVLEAAVTREARRANGEPPGMFDEILDRMFGGLMPPMPRSRRKPSHGV